MSKPTVLIRSPGYLAGSWSDPDETEGRRLYRAEANAQALHDEMLDAFQKNIKLVSLQKDPSP